MNFLKKIFNISQKEDKEIQKQEVKLNLDDLFVHNFVEKGGKFLYCAQKQEIIENLNRILSENNWNQVHILDQGLTSFLKKKDVKLIKNFKEDTPIFTSCEHLIADNGDVLFSSNQLGSLRLNEYSNNFIVYATTSQLVKDTGQGLTGIKMKSPKTLPTNISSIRNYDIHKNEDNFLNYGNSNSKNLYLLLLEDL